MTLYKIKLVCITLILLLAGCREKDELTFPVKVHFKIDISLRISTISSYLSFTGGQIGVQRIRFEGDRETGEDVFFQTDPKINFQPVVFFTQPRVTISVFDIPQGIYNYMKWDINLKRIATAGLIDDDDTDSLHIGLVIGGYYSCLDEWEEWGIALRIPFFIVIDDTEYFSVISDNPEGNSTIVLSENKYHEAILLLSPEDAFLSISRESLEEAVDISRDKGHQMIIISRNENEDLYENLCYRIMRSAKVIVK